MSNHITVRIVQADVIIFSRLDCLNNFISDFSTFHPWTLFKRNNIRRNFNVILKFFVKFSLTVSIKEVSHMTIFLSLRNRHKMNTRFCKIFTHCSVNARRINKILVRNVRITIVFHHAGIFARRNALSVKMIKFAASLKSICNLKGTVTTEIVQNNRISILNSSNRLSVFRNYKFMHILIQKPSLLLAVSLNCLCSRLKLTALAKNMRIPATLNHRPVSIVTVHCNKHTTATRSNPVIRILERSKIFLQRSNKSQRRSRVNIAAVKQRMNADFLDSFFISLGNHRLKMVNMTVNISVRNKSDKMQSRILILYIFNQLFPGFTLIHQSRLNRFTNKFRTLGKNTTATNRIVTNFAVSHIIIARKSNSSSMSLKFCVRTISCEPVQILHFRSLYRIAFNIFSVSNAIHNNQNNRTTTTFPIWIFLQSMHCICHL